MHIYFALLYTVKPIPPKNNSNVINETVYNLDDSVNLIILTKEKLTASTSERDTQIEVYESLNYRKLNLSICDDDESKIFKTCM